MKLVALAYGVICYLIFFAAFLYAIAFVGCFVVPRTIDNAPTASLVATLVIDSLLLGVFAVQHSVMARPAFKAWWTKFVPPPIERSTYVLFSSLALVLLYWQWRALPAVVWSVQSPAAVTAIDVAFWAGWGMVLLSTFLINHFDLFGLRQVWAYRRNQQIPPSDFRTPMFYKVVRHPIYLGFIVAFWAAPTMTQGHLLFAFATTAYILIAIQFEEHDLVTMFGNRYLTYRTQVSMIIPLPRGGRGGRSANSA
jgi:protein-S-isoprenylcysteine O-methyltransferase Ste14